MRTSAVFRPVVGAGILAACLLVANPAQAQPPNLPLRVWLEEGMVLAQPDLAYFFDAGRRKALESGFTTTLALALALECEAAPEAARGAPPPVTLRIRYDVWEERYLIETLTPEREEAAGGGDFTAPSLQRVDGIDAAVERLRRPPPARLAPLEAIPNGATFRVHMRLIQNPMSPEETARVRAWIENPLGQDERSGWIGSMIGLLVGAQSGGFDSESLESVSGDFRRLGDTIRAEN